MRTIDAPVRCRANEVDAASGALVALLAGAALAVGGLFELGVQAGSPMAGAVAAVGAMFAAVGVLSILLQRV